jgi:hypothetical protein
MAMATLPPGQGWQPALAMACELAWGLAY